ncbi:hypothetical protein DERP_001128 [Dermatophagoides pteronyssinus]|uniref:Uncharacterized protein n=1 Tax=Dermatophagoides pteronyssinus TaxID=6956 RepID=A0ABQ8JDK5_DERPT|nr:hypothetical protein DERP_001128 [Dermatophagoides pteronyssinus]
MKLTVFFKKENIKYILGYDTINGYCSIRYKRSMIRFMNTFPMIINIKISIAFIEDNNDDDKKQEDEQQMFQYWKSESK